MRLIPRTRPTRSAMLLSFAMTAAAIPAFPRAQSAAPQAPSPTAEAVMQRADREDMRPVLMKLVELGAKPIEQLSVEQARSQPTPADAVKAVLRDQGKDPQAIAAAMDVAKRDITYPTGGGEQKIRLYTPANAQGPLPVIVYYHGGGWVIADIDTYESSAMALAKKTGAIVASVEYRKAPEHKFPAAHQDAFAAYVWVRANAATFGGDPARIAVAGESAGGNLAIGTSMMARAQSLPLPLHMLLVYPVAGTDLDTPSYRSFANAAPLSKAGMEWFVDKALASPADKQSPLLNVYQGADLAGLPAATIINAEIDPLASDGERLFAALRRAGVPARHHVETGVTHEFFGMDAVLDDARRAQDIAVAALRDAFTQTPRR